MKRKMIRKAIIIKKKNPASRGFFLATKSFSIEVDCVSSISCSRLVLKEMLITDADDFVHSSILKIAFLTWERG